MSLKQRVARKGVHPPLTACCSTRGKKLPVPALRVVRLILVEPDAAPPRPTGRTAWYAGVSSADQRTDLSQQVARVTGRVTPRGECTLLYARVLGRRAAVNRAARAVLAIATEPS